MPNIPSVRLIRRLRHFVSRAEDERLIVGSSPDPFAMFIPGTTTIGKNLHTKTVLHEMGTAAWWELDGQNEPNTRLLQGEIHLSADLEPSCASEIFTVEVKKFI